MLGRYNSLIAVHQFLDATGPEIKIAKWFAIIFIWTLDSNVSNRSDPSGNFMIDLLSRRLNNRGGSISRAN